VFPVELDRFIYWVPVLELLNIFAQNLHIYLRNDSTSVCIIHFIYILVLEDVIGSDVAGARGSFLARTVECNALTLFQCYEVNWMNWQLPQH